MKKVSVTDDCVIVVPDTVSESGLMQWLALRFKGKKIKLEFDTTRIGDDFYHPALWFTVDKS